MKRAITNSPSTHLSSIIIHLFRPPLYPRRNFRPFTLQVSPCHPSATSVRPQVAVLAGIPSVPTSVALAVAQLSWWIVFQLHEGRLIAQIQHDLGNSKSPSPPPSATNKPKPSSRFGSAAAFRTWWSMPASLLHVTPAARARLDHVAAGRMRMFIGESVFPLALLLLVVCFTCIARCRRNLPPSIGSPRSWRRRTN